jgi:hypothetical protein
MLLLQPLVAGAATFNAVTCGLDDVRDAVSAAEAAGYGHTVSVPAGNCTWTPNPKTDALTITKYMTLQGAGMDGTGTNITQGINSTFYGLIRYTPDQTSRDAEDLRGGLFRVTGFEFDGTSPVGENYLITSRGIVLSSNATDKYYYNIRVDHCSFYNFNNYWNTPDHTSNDPVYYGYGLHLEGLFFGVMDNCYHNFSRGMNAYAIGGQNAGYGWIRAPVELGSEHAFFIEDCEFDNFFRIVGSGHGGRYVLRFNRSHDVQTTSDVHSNVWSDMHGNFQRCCFLTPTPAFFPETPTGQVRGTVLSEGYCNKIDDAPATTATRSHLWGHRGGISVFWGNLIDIPRNARVWISEEDALYYFKTVPTVVNYGGINYMAKVDHVADNDNKPPNATYWTTAINQNQRVYPWTLGAHYKNNHGYDPVRDSYYWLNSNVNASGSYSVNVNNMCSTGLDGLEYCSGSYIQENRDWWQEKTSFAGSSGVGVGTRAQMDAITPTAPGVGFFVQNEGTWNTSAGTSGRHNPLGYTGQGRLYRSVSNGQGGYQWQLYYEPYTYPHPLRNEGGTPPEPECDASHLYLCTESGPCIAAGGYWWGTPAQCNATPEPTCSTDPDYCADEATCTAAGWHYYDGDCHADPAPSCAAPYYEQCTDGPSCTAIGGVWQEESGAADPQIPAALDYSAGGWAPVGAVDLVDAVNEPTADDDASYTATTGTETLRYLYSRATTIGTASSVVVTIRTRNTTGAGTMRAHLRLAGSNYYGTTFDVGTGYQDYVTIWTYNPRTMQAWTPDDLNGLGDNYLHSYGLNPVTVSGEVRVTAVKITPQGTRYACAAPDDPPDPPATSAGIIQPWAGSTPSQYNAGGGVAMPAY